MVQTLETAQGILLGPEGRAFRSRHVLGDAGPGAAGEAPDVSDAEVARLIEDILRAVGTHSQRRTRRALERRCALFHEGVEYILEEAIHKAYESEKDIKRCYALQGGAVIFDSVHGGLSSPGDISIRAWLPGPWVGSLVSLAATLPGRQPGG